jgi:hypothetical protein
MGLDYYRIQRPSIYHPATIGDIPFEVIQKTLSLLGTRSLVSASVACRAWRQAAGELLISNPDLNDEEGMTRFICGMQLKTLVCGFKQFSIKKLNLFLNRARVDFARLIAQMVSSSLSSLKLEFERDLVEGNEAPDIEDCYEVLEIFLARCPRIRSLDLSEIEFGDDSSSFTPTIKEGLSRLNFLELGFCTGNFKMFAEQAPLQNLSKLVYGGIFADPAFESIIISSLASKCRALKSITLKARFDSSWEFIHKIAECCPDLEEIDLHESFREQLTPFTRSAFEALAFLPRLKSLNLGDCDIDEVVGSPLTKWKGLRHLVIKNAFSSDVLRAIGGNLVYLRCSSKVEGLEDIVEHCPELEKLYIRVEDEDGEDLGEEALGNAEGLIKCGLKSLAKLFINGRKIRLGNG